MIICSKCGAANLPTATQCYNCKTPLVGKSLSAPKSSSSSVAVTFKPDLLVLPTGAQVTLKGIMSIGSDPTQCQIPLKDPSVSPVHAQIEVVQPGTVMLKDLGSTAGTAVNGFLLPRGGAPAQLANNTKIDIGKVTLVYLRGTPPPPLTVISSSSIAVSSSTSSSVTTSPPKVKTLTTSSSKSSISLSPFVKTISSFLLPSPSSFSGYAVGVHISQQKMPISPGRIMVILALCLLAFYLLIALIPLGIIALIIGCTFFPVAMLAMGLFGYFGKLILGNDVVQQTSFRVQDPSTKTAVPVVLFSDRGGSIILSENDKVTVHGVLQPNNTLLANHVEVEEQNGVVMTTPAVIRGKLPISLQMGLIWLMLAMLPCIWIWLASIGSR